MLSNGCHNKPRAAGYWANDGYEVLAESADGNTRVVARRQVWIEDVMSKDCRYDFRSSDPLCVGCDRH